MSLYSLVVSSQLQFSLKLKTSLENPKKLYIFLQIEEFQASLMKISSGDLGVVDSISAMQLAIQGAISQVGIMFGFLCPFSSIQFAK